MQLCPQLSVIAYIMHVEGQCLFHTRSRACERARLLGMLWVAVPAVARRCVPCAPLHGGAQLLHHDQRLPNAPAEIAMEQRG